VLGDVEPERLDQRLAQLLANNPALIGALAVESSLDLEQGVDAVFRRGKRTPYWSAPLGVDRLGVLD
jgi:hypothetical protein